MREYVVKILSADGRTLRRFATFAGSKGGAFRRGYEAAEGVRGAADVVVVQI